MLRNLIRHLFTALFVITPLVVYPRTSELFEFNKMLVIYFTTSVIFLLFVLDWIRFKRTIRYNYLYLIALGIFLLSQLLATIFSIDIHTSIFGYYGRFNGGLLSIISYMTLTFIFINVFVSREEILKLFRWSLLSSLIVILWAIPGKFGHDLTCLVVTGQFSNACWTNQFDPAARAFSTLGQPNWMGAYLAINFFIGIYFFLTASIIQPQSDKEKSTILSFIKNNWYFILISIYLFLNFSSILFTRSRSALGATIICIILFVFWLLFVRPKEWMKKLLIAAVLMIIPIIIFKTGVDKIDQILRPHITKSKTVNIVKTIKPNPLLATTDITESFDIRKIVWDGALALGNKYPLFGTGVETFGYSYYFVRPAAHNLVSEWDFLYNKAHNEYLNYFATTGYMGLIAYLGVILIVIGYFVKQIFGSKLPMEDRSLSVCLLLAYITILITNFFGFSTTTINLFFYLLPVSIIVYNRQSRVEQEVKRKIKGKSYAILTISSIFFLYSLYFLYNYFSADLKYAQSEALAQQNEYQPSSALLQQALGQHYEHVYEDKLSYNLANLAFLASYQKQASTANTLIQLSTYYNDKSLLASPENVLYWKTKAKNAYLFYQTSFKTSYLKDGLDALNNARKLAPTDPKIPYSLALFYSLLEDESGSAKDVKTQDLYRNQSLQEIDRSLVLKNNYRDAYFLKAQLLKKYGQFDQAKQTLEYILGHLDPNDQEVKKELQTL